MSRIRDHAADFPWHLRKAGVRVSNGAYRLTRPYRTLRGEVRNRRNRRFLETGKGFAFERAMRPVRSSLPVYRDRTNPATGRPRRDDRMMGAAADRSAARWRETRSQLRDFDCCAGQGHHAAPQPEAWERSPDAYRHAPAENYRSAAPRSRARSR